MSREIIVLICAALALQINCDLTEEVEAELENLRASVEGEIMVAHDNLDNTQVDFLTYADNTEQTVIVSLEESRQTYWDEIQELRDLALAAGKDPSDCSDNRATVVDLYLQDMRDQSAGCIHFQNDETRRVVRDARYIVDVYINKVHDFDFQINRCNGDILCLSPIVTEIALDQVRLPQNIRTEVSAAGSLTSTLRLKVQECSDSGLSQYENVASMIVVAISHCITSLLNGD